MRVRQIDPSISGTVGYAKQFVRIEQQAIALGGRVTYLEDSQGATASPSAPAPPAGSTESAADAAYNRGWEYWKQIVGMY